jgi:hypothetical protein
MDGVIILETIQTFKTGLLLAIGFDVCAIFFFIDLFRKRNKGETKYPFMLIGIPVAVVVAIAFLIFAPDSAKYETEYKVIVSDEVNFEEFTQKYEVISVKDDLYTVKEK